jgi:16S rRNA (cytosine967-C5)-methyltransferase
MKRPSARSVALDVIVAVLKDDAYANLLLSSRIRAAGLDSRDAGLATELCHGTLRGRGKYDSIIALCTDRPLEKIHPVVLAALEMGIHQHVAMRVLTHALVNETVQLVRDSGMAAASGFANAIMRRATERSTEEWDAVLRSNASDEISELSTLTSHPAWIIRAFDSALKADGRSSELRALLDADNSQSALGIADLRPTGEKLAGVEPSTFSPFGFHLVSNGDPSTLTSAHHGFVRVQDEGSQLAALALVAAAPVREGEDWLDMCSAPGGKSAVLAHFASTSSCHVLANEANPGRIELVKRSIAPWPEAANSTRDGRDFSSEPNSFDRILVDAPCSGLGALRRRPEARWRKTPADIATLTKLQEQLLLSAIDAVRPGGVVAYVTCSPHLAETRAIVNSALKKRTNTSELNTQKILATVTRTAIPSPSDSKSLQLWPHAHNTDAMFIALISKHE